MLCNGLVLSSLQRFNGSPDVLFAGCSSVNLLGQSNDAFPSLGSAQRVSLLSLSLSLLCLALPASWSLGVVRPTIFGSAQAQAIHLFFYSSKLSKSFASAKKKKLNLENTHNRASSKYKVSPDLNPMSE